MSRARRVGGSGWAGLHGSFIGLPKAGGGGKRIVLRGKKPNKPAPDDIDFATLPDSEEVQKAAKRVIAVRSDIEQATKRLNALNAQLALTMEKLRYAINLANPGRRPQRSQRPKGSKKGGSSK